MKKLNPFESVENLADTGIVTWGNSCSKGKGFLNYDSSKTAAKPQPVQKGSDVVLHLEGGVTQPIDVTNIHIHVLWNGAPLDDEDKTPSTTHFDQTFSYDCP